jgi:hypothetical protein
MHITETSSMNTVKIGTINAGDRVWVKTGCYAPKSYLENGEPVRHIRGIVKEVLPPNIVAVNFDGYLNTVDMICRELVKGF